ncbi:unnamed protein product, partial [Meganyctiphanes norvegica]
MSGGGGGVGIGGIFTQDLLPVSNWLTNKLVSNLYEGESRNAGRVHVCPVCFHKFESPYKLNRHLRIHTGERPFSCPHCPHRSSRKDALQHHVLAKHSNLANTQNC